MMSDVLSQLEIDSLLSALSSGEIDAEELKENEEKHVKNYDFKRPLKFSKDHLRTLEIIFEHYGRLLSNHLSTHLRKNTQVEVMNSEAIVFSEFTNSLPNPVLLSVVDFNPLEGNILIELGNNLGYSIIDRLLGGFGESISRKREFTEIEITILERVFDIFVNLLVDPWLNVVELEPRLDRIETNAQFAQIVEPNEMTAIVTLKLSIGKVDGMINVCLPYSTMESVIEKLNTRYWYSTAQENVEGEYKEIIEATINRTKIPIRAILGKSTISVQDFLGLQTGDIIRLDSKTGQELDIFVGNIKKFKAYPGTFSKSYAVQLSSILREE